MRAGDVLLDVRSSCELVGKRLYTIVMVMIIIIIMKVIILTIITMILQFVS